MEWLLTNTQIHSTFASLGSVQGENYVPSQDCLEILEEINYKLEAEDQTLRSFRRAIGFGQNVRNDIIPLLVNVKDQRLIEASIRILVNLTIPVECLMPVDSMLASDLGRHTVFELNKLLADLKEAFTDAKTTKCVLDHMKVLLDSEDHEETACAAKMTSRKNCGEINNCLLLLRNILNIPELHKNYFNLPSMQNQIIWNLFTQSVDRILLQVMTCPERSHWCVTLVQLIALIFKDQHVNTLQKLLNICFEAAISESSEDNESNTSPVKESNSDSSPMLTSDPTTSDSSDNGGTAKKRNNDERRNSDNMTSGRKGVELEKVTVDEEQKSPKIKEEEPETSPIDEGKEGTSFSPPAPSAVPVAVAKPMNKIRGMLSPTSELELSDCGYGTQVENPESISTSSTEDYGKPPVHQKPPATNQKQRLNSANKPRKVLSTVEKTEWRRKKLVKRSRSTMINMKGLINHTPTDDDITNILKEFTVDFLLKGYGLLVEDLHEQLMTDVQLKIDTSHFFWLVTYFLKFAAQLELDLSHVQSIFTFDIVGYAVYEAVGICEQLDLSGFDLVPSLRRLHLSVTAIREFLQAIETYKKISHLRKEDLRYLRKLEVQIGCSEDLRSLFVLLLRRFNPSIQSKQYLQDVIVTNHQLLMLLDQVARRSEVSLVDDHIRHFASVDILHWFGYLLEDFHENGDFVNDCIFTMLHHVAGDLGQVSMLFQPIILKAFSKIWDTEFVMCDDWSDLVEYVINKFISNPQSPQRGISLDDDSGKGTLAAGAAKMKIDEEEKPQPCSSTTLSVPWTEEEIDSLNWYFAQANGKENPVEEVARQWKENSHKKRTNKEIVDQLCALGLLTDEQLEKFSPAPEQVSMNMNDGEKQDLTHSMTKTPNPPTDDVKFLVNKLSEENPRAILWLQRVLLECSFIKSQVAERIRTNQDLFLGDVGGEQVNRIMEPTLLIFILKKQSIPLIIWTTDQTMFSMSPPFVLLLHKLGFHLPADARKLFARIPEFWTADHLLAVAEKLGPVLQRFPSQSQSGGNGALDLVNSDGYPGDSATTSATRRTSAFSGTSLTNWTDSPSAKHHRSAAAMTKTSSTSGRPTDTSRKESLEEEKEEEDARSVAAVMDEDEEIADVFARDPPLAEALDGISLWETASQVSSVSGMVYVSEEESISYGNI